MGVNLRMEGRKLLLYLLNALLWGQLKGSYSGCGWHANQEPVSWSGQLTLIVKCSDKLFHGVNEDGEFGGFSFTGGSEGQSGQEWKLWCHEGQSVWCHGSVLRCLGCWGNDLEI